jgi:acyl dehydratase
MLKRNKTSSSDSKTKRIEANDFAAQNTDHWKVDSNIGRRYARVSGDFNFIHLHKLSAILFGFNNAIAHGMWSKARVIASLESQLPEGPFKVDIKFKLPIFLPAKIQLQSKINKNDEVEFQLMDSTGEKPHLTGKIIKVKKPSQ